MGPIFPAHALDLAVEPVIFDESSIRAVSAAAYYVSLFSVLTVLVGVSLALRQFVWTAYTGLVILGLSYVGLLEQNVSGIVWSGLSLSSRALILFGHIMITANFVVAAMAIAPGHRFARYKKPLLLVALLLWSLWIAGLALPLAQANLLFNIAGASCAIAHFLPFSTFTKLQGGPDTVVRYGIWSLLLLAILAAVLLSAGVVGDVGDTILVNRMLILFIMLFFVFFFIRHIYAVHGDRQKFIQKSLDQALTQAQINKELLEAEKRYAAAREIARIQNMRLATASHDIRQPISSLRSAVAVLGKNQPPEVRQQLRNAFDYLDQLASGYMAEAKSRDVEGEEDAIDPRTLAERERLDTGEIVSADLIVSTLARMFADEARQRGLRFESSSMQVQLKTQPLALMRILSNLVANAIKHTSVGRVGISVRTEGVNVLFEVANSGGLSVSSDGMFDTWYKGDASEGMGLGLAIVRQQAADAGLMITCSETADGETLFSVQAPIHVASATERNFGGL